MGDFIRRHLFPIAAVVFVLVVVLTVVVVRQIGQAYKTGLSEFENRQAEGPTELVKTANIRKVTVKKGDDPQCIEVTPDGAVRIYETCGGEMTDAYRSTDTRSVQRLFKGLGAQPFSKTAIPNALEVTIEMDDGSVVTIYIPTDGSGGSAADEITDAVDDIISQKPEPSVTPPPFTATPTPTLPPGATPTPTIPGYQPTQTPAPTPEDTTLQPFTCDFSDAATGGKKPYRVSNVVCTSEPQPAQ